MGAEVGARILLVEDDPTIFDLLAYYLRRAGFQVTQEYGGRLRGKLRCVDARVDIVGVRGVGYRLAVPVAADGQDPKSVGAAESRSGSEAHPV